MLDLRADKFDNILMAFSLACAMAFGTITFNEKLIRKLIFTSAYSLKNIGHVNTSKNDVRRKYSKSFSWMSLDSNEMLYENDTLFTGPDSEANLALNQDVTIKMNPNSLIVLKFQNEQLILDLKTGSTQLRLAQNKKIHVLQNGTVTAIQGQSEQNSIELQKTENNNLQMKSTEGASSVQTAEKQIQLSAADPQSNQLNMGEVTPVEAPVVEMAEQVELSSEVADATPPPPPPAQLLPPQRLQQVKYTGQSKTVEEYINKAIPVQIGWSPVKDAKGYQVMVSRDPEFKNPVFQTKTLYDKILVKLTDKGKYFYKVASYTADNRNSEFSTTAQIQFNKTLLLQPPVIAQPENQLNIVVFGGAVTPIVFDFNKDENADTYHLQVATDANFSHIVYEQAYKENNFLLRQDFHAEKIYWRMRSEFEDQVSKWSEVRTIQFQGS